MDTQSASKVVYVLSGLPFSGKTTIAAELLKANDVLLIERDCFLDSINQEPDTRARIKARSLLIADPVSRLAATTEENAWNDALTLEYIARVRAAIGATEKTAVVVDGTHLQPLSRSFIRGIRGWTRIAIVIKTDPETCIQRFEKANVTGIRATITPDLIRRMHAVFEPPTREEGFEEVRFL